MSHTIRPTVAAQPTENEAVQDAWVSYLKSGANSIRSPNAFFATIRRRRAQDLRRRESLRTTQELQVVDHPVSRELDPCESAMRAELQEIVSELPLVEREMIYRHYWLKQTYPEIAEILGGSVESVKKACQRAVARLGRDPRVVSMRV